MTLCSPIELDTMFTQIALYTSATDHCGCGWGAPPLLPWDFAENENHKFEQVTTTTPVS
jgi:hypothetical protein